MGDPKDERQADKASVGPEHEEPGFINAHASALYVK